MAGRHSRRTLVLTAAAVWIAALCGLALWTANPVTLNRTQLLLASSTGAVIIADVVNARTGELKVVEVVESSGPLKTEVAPGQTLQVASLDKTGARNHDRIIAPLILESGSLAIAPTPVGVFSIYPATPPVIAQVEELVVQP